MFFLATTHGSKRVNCVFEGVGGSRAYHLFEIGSDWHRVRVGVALIGVGLGLGLALHVFVSYTVC